MNTKALLYVCNLAPIEKKTVASSCRWAYAALTNHSLFKVVFRNGFLALLVAGLSINSIYAQDYLSDDMEKQLQQMQVELAKQTKEIEKQAKKLKEQTEKQIKNNLKRMHTGLAQLDQISNMQIPPVPPVPPVKVPDIMDPEKMIREFDGEIIRKDSEDTYDVQPGTELSIDAKFTSIHITPSSYGNQMTVKTTQLGGAKTKKIAEEIANRFSIEKTQERNEVSIKIELDEEDKDTEGNILIHCFLTISLPKDTSIEVVNEFGGVRYENIEGEIESHNKFGSTVIKGTKGELAIESSYGSLNIDGHEGDADIHSEFGNVNIQRLNGDMDFDNSYGNADIGFMNPEAEADFNLSFGNATIHLPKTFNGEIEGKTSFGNIIVAGNSVQGNFQGEMDGEKESKGVKLKFKTKKDMFNQSIECTTGDGDGSLDIDASYTTVYVNFDL